MCRLQGLCNHISLATAVLIEYVLNVIMIHKAQHTHAHTHKTEYIHTHIDKLYALYLWNVDRVFACDSSVHAILAKLLVKTEYARSYSCTHS